VSIVIPTRASASSAGTFPEFGSVHTTIARPSQWEPIGTTRSDPSSAL
jgi:hypothetical protein